MPNNIAASGNNLRTHLPKAENVTRFITPPVQASAGGVEQVNNPSATYELLKKRWTMTRALMEGTDAMREAGEKFLPKESAETTTSYAIRLKRSVLFGAFKKTITTSTGRPFSRPITFNGFSAILEDLNQNIDLQGNNIHVFARHLFMSGLAHGHAFLMIDHPTRPDISGEITTEPSLEDERDMNLRPFWRKVEPYNVIGWRSAIIGGVEIPLQVRIRENTTKPVGMFGERIVKRVRVLEPGNFRVFEQQQTGDWLLVSKGMYIKADGSPFTIIPFIPFYSTLPNQFYVTTPTMLDLAFMNISHWQSSSDQDNILHVARVPILFGSGFFDDDDLEIGSSRWIKGPDGSDLKYVEHSGAAIEAGSKSLEELENRMRIMGAEILVRDPARVTATAKVLDSDEATSELQDIVTRFEDVLATAYGITAEWMGEGEEAVGDIGIFKDFGISAQAFQESNQLLQTRLAKQITQETFLVEIQRRGLLGDETDIEAEVALTKDESEVARQQMQDSMDLNRDEDEDEENE